jgi:hypothetical protein
MNHLVPKILLALTCASATGALGWMCVLRPGAPERSEEFFVDCWIGITDAFKNPNDEVGNGTEVCARCGAMRQVLLKRSGKRDLIPVESPEHAWAESRIGPCADHLWQPTGCWGGRNSVTCFRTPDVHPLWKALSNLGGEQADEAARRFAGLPTERQLELWQESMRGSDTEIARYASEQAGWSDLAAFWAD